ncbi:MAG: hypothetical protein ABIY52_09735 [Gemmatimonadaceae bacterium]
MRHLLFLAAITLGTLAQPVRAQQVAYAANVPEELDSATAVAVSREIARARDRGIPVEPLIAKVREGRLKRARGPLIRLAVARLAERMDSARVALGITATSEELVAGAEALGAGAGSPSLKSVRAATTRSIAAPLGTLAQLVLSGVAPPRAVEMIVSLLKRNAAPGMVLALGNMVEADVATGLGADQSAIIRLRGIEASLGTGDALTASSPGMTPPAISKPTPKPVRRP